MGSSLNVASASFFSVIIFIVSFSATTTTTDGAYLFPSLPVPSPLTSQQQNLSSSSSTSPLVDSNDNNGSTATDDNDLCLLSSDKFTASCNDLKRAGIAMNRDGLTADDCAQVQAYNECRKTLLAEEGAIRQCRAFIAAKIRQMDENIDKFCAPVLANQAQTDSAAAAKSCTGLLITLLAICLLTATFQR